MKQLSNIPIILLFWWLAGCKSGPQENLLPYYNTPDFTPVWANKKEVVTKITHSINDFSFTDQDGKIISHNNIKGKIHVANFFFSKCSSICPKMTANFETLQKTFATNDDVVLLSYSIMPRADSVQQLKKYALKYGVNPARWHLLTGSQSAIYLLARQSYFAEEQIGFAKDSTEFLHTEHFILVDKQSHIRGIYNGTLPLETERLKEDINILLKE